MFDMVANWFDNQGKYGKIAWALIAALAVWITSHLEPVDVPHPDGSPNVEIIVDE